MSKLHIRRANASDLAWIMAEMKDFVGTFNTKKSLYDKEAMSTIAAEMIKKHFVIVAENEKKELVGTLGALIQPHHFNPAVTMATELWWWVPVKHRGSRVGLVLLKVFMEWGEKNVDLTVLSTEATSNIKPASLEKRGFTFTERTFIRER